MEQTCFSMLLDTNEVLIKHVTVIALMWGRHADLSTHRTSPREKQSVKGWQYTIINFCWG
jgi:hypothetical protein